MTFQYRDEVLKPENAREGSTIISESFNPSYPHSDKQYFGLDSLAGLSRLWEAISDEAKQNHAPRRPNDYYREEARRTASEPKLEKLKYFICRALEVDTYWGHYWLCAKTRSCFKDLLEKHKTINMEHHNHDGLMAAVKQGCHICQTLLVSLYPKELGCVQQIMGLDEIPKYAAQIWTNEPLPNRRAVSLLFGQRDSDVMEYDLQSHFSMGRIGYIDRRFKFVSCPYPDFPRELSLEEMSEPTSQRPL